MDANKPTRKTYIRRKRCLNQSIQQIKNTLLYIMKNSGNPINESEILKYATSRAQEIEAACWSPRLKISDAEYSQIIYLKTYQLCNVLITQNKALMQAPYTLMNQQQYIQATENSIKSNFNISHNNHFQPNVHGPAGTIIYINPLTHQNFSSTDSTESIPQNMLQVTHNEDDQQDETSFFFNQSRVSQERNEFPQSIYWDK